MMGRVPLLAAATLAVLRVHCSYGPAEIRVHNASHVHFDKVLVNFSGQLESYGEIGAGETSTYHAVEKAYRYAYVEVHFADTTAVLQPIDYVGEKPLREGKYTYQLTLSQDPDSVLNRLSLDLITDR